MPTNTHQHKRTRVRISTIHTDLLGTFVEWGAEATRERRHTIPAVWWNPFSWGRSEWRREGSPPGFDELTFLRGDGQALSPTILQPATTIQPGYVKVSVTFGALGGTPTDLGNDARSVAKVRLRYTWRDRSYVLHDP